MDGCEVIMDTSEAAVRLREKISFVERSQNVSQSEIRVVFVIVTTIALVSLLSLRALKAQTRQPPSARERWEYCTVNMVTPGSGGWKAQVSRGSNVENVDSDITGIYTVNRLGFEGWELVSVVHERGNSVEYFLKRPLR
jgi:hypothetical protein